MPRRCVAPLLAAILLEQDDVIHRCQALEAGLTRGAIEHRLSTGQWRRLLPQVFLAVNGDPSRRQLMIGALLWAGTGSAIDAAEACRFHGISSATIEEEIVHVVVPDDSSARSRGYVVVRRTSAPIRMVVTDRLRYAEPAAAVIAATRSTRSSRRVLAVLSDALQRTICTYDELVCAHIQGPPKNARLADDALEALGAGTRSAPEADFRRLVEASSLVGKVEYNVWVRLPSGHVVCLDALIEESAVAHESNGRSWHAREDLFEDMQERHDVVTTAGFVVLHNAPRRTRTRGRDVITQFEGCHALYAGRGLPPGVVRIPPPSMHALPGINGARTDRVGQARARRAKSA